MIVSGRNPVKLQTTVDALRQATENIHVSGIQADLASIGEVRQLAEQVQAQYARLDGLVNNAGTYLLQRKETVDGLEQTFAVNYFSHFVLSHLLRERLQQSAPARIVCISSATHGFFPHMDLADMPYRHKHYLAGLREYTQSKLSMLHLTYELARRLTGTGITANCYDPGFVRTAIGSESGQVLGFGMQMLGKLWRTPTKGAETGVYLATDAALTGISGGYFRDCQSIRAARVAYDVVTSQALWERSMALAGQFMGSASRPHMLQLAQ